MKKLTAVNVLSAVLIIIMSSCTRSKPSYSTENINGVVYHKNSGEANGEFRPAVNFLFEIKGPENVPDSMKYFGEIARILTDFNENIYVLDRKHATIKKFTSDGRFDKYFPEQRGIDISQFKEPTQFAALYDTLIVFDSGGEKMVRYLMNGDFISSQFLLSGFKPVFFLSDSKTNLSSFVWKQANIDSVRYQVNDLCLINERFKVSAVIKEIRVPVDEIYPQDLFTTYDLKDGIFYVAENKGYDYRIYQINASGKVTDVIEKDHMPQAYSKEEVEALNQFVTSMNFPPLDINQPHFKKPVNSVSADKKGRLWVRTSAERNESNMDSVYVDIFDRGKFINTAVMSFVGPGEMFYLLGSRIFVISEDRKSFRVYSY